MGEKALTAKNHIRLGECMFDFICVIEPDRDTDGCIKEFMPQLRYEKASTTRLNPNGKGPFCRFKFSSAYPYSGVYAVTVSDALAYIGETVNLSNRWGLSQFGSIQPKNCYTRGQSTNCKINYRILEACKKGEPFKLWFHRTDDHKQIEDQLLDELNPPWNG